MDTNTRILKNLRKILLMLQQINHENVQSFILYASNLARQNTCQIILFQRIKYILLL